MEVYRDFGGDNTNKQKPIYNPYPENQDMQD